MQTIVKIILLLLVSDFGYSQIYYSNYLDATSEWRSYGVSYTGGTQTMYSTIYFDGFENYNGYTYYKKYAVVNYNGEIIYNPNSYVLYREGSDGNFYVVNPATGIEQIDFQNNNISVATVGVPFNTFYNHQNDVCNISLVQNILLSGLTLKHLIGTLGLSTGIAEGIGEVGPTCLPTLDGGGGLICYTKQGQTIQFDASIDCSVFPIPQYQNLSTVQFNIDINVYPNPSSNFVIVGSENIQIENIELYDLQGRILKNIKINSLSYKLDISGYQQGTYLLRIATTSGIKTLKVVKE